MGCEMDSTASGEDPMEYFKENGNKTSGSMKLNPLTHWQC
jgi:hypothetical protein